MLVILWKANEDLTNSMREVASRAATQELSRILWNPNVHYRVTRALQ
jgi:hypothetical protein